MRAIQPPKGGGPEVLVLREVPTPEPQLGEVLVKIEAIGINFLDVLRRGGKAAAEAAKTPPADAAQRGPGRAPGGPGPSGRLAMGATPPQQGAGPKARGPGRGRGGGKPIDPNAPLQIGFEGAGVIEAVGPEAGDCKVGDRVCWTNSLTGSYATHAILRARHAIPLPPGIDAKTAASSLMLGVTAHYLTTDVYALKNGSTCLVYNVSSGLGNVLLQVAKIAGAEVFGVVNEQGRENQMYSAGLDHPLNTRSDIPVEVRRMTAGNGVNVVYETAGGRASRTAIATVRARGLLVLCGPVIAPSPKLDPSLLAKRGSLFVTRPALRDYATTRGEMLRRANQVFAWIQERKLVVPVEASFPLAAARLAHERIAKGSTGKLMLVP